LTPGNRLLTQAITSAINGAITCFLGVWTARIVFVQFLASDRLANAEVVLAVVFCAVGQFTLVPILQKVLVESPGSFGAPPLNAEFLFYLFLDVQKCDAIVGDLEERYKLISKKFGARRANFWYWTQAIQSVGPIAWAWAKKAALKPVLGVIAWVVAKGLVGHDSWLAALVEIWKRIRL